MRVLQVTPRFYPMMGGTESHVYETSRRLVSAVDVTVLTTDLSRSLPKADVVAGVPVVRVPAWPRERDYYLAPGIYHHIRTGSYDLVHCQGVHTAVPIAAMLAARHQGLPYVVTFHTGGHSSRLRHAARAGQWTLLRPLLREAQRLVCVAQFEAERFGRILSVPQERFVVIPNGGDLPVPPVDATRAPRTTILSVGRLERYKGHHRILAALPHIRAQLADARLRVVGSGPYEGPLRRLADRLGIGDAVEFLSVPPADRQAMARILSEAHVLALLSDYEAQPVAVMEALALGVPTVVARTSGLAELAAQGVTRAVELDADPRTVAAALVREIRDPLRPDHVDLPSWELCAERLRGLYDGVLRHRMGPAA
ncbi:MAG TPA: glycosyltransferase family 4 protein [Actinomycetes bacterium]|nr:glycosyltransferase family 4 protein [Actinomycetes bacterium]